MQLQVHEGEVIPDRDAAWARRIAAGGPDGLAARNELVMAYMPLARWCARQVWWNVTCHEDVQQTTFMWLIHAASTWDSTRGNFYSYARLVCMQRACRERAALRAFFHVSETWRAQERDVKSAFGHLMQKLARAPTLGEAAAWLGLDEDQVGGTLRRIIAETPAQLSAVVAEEDTDALNMAGAEAVEMPDTMGYAAVARLLPTLPDRERQMLQEYYSTNEPTQVEVSKKHGLSRERARQILRQMQGLLRDKLLQAPVMTPVVVATVRAQFADEVAARALTAAKKARIEELCFEVQQRETARALYAARVQRAEENRRHEAEKRAERKAQLQKAKQQAQRAANTPRRTIACEQSENFPIPGVGPLASVTMLPTLLYSYGTARRVRIEIIQAIRGGPLVGNDPLRWLAPSLDGHALAFYAVKTQFGTLWSVGLYGVDVVPDGAA